MPLEDLALAEHRRYVQRLEAEGLRGRAYQALLGMGNRQHHQDDDDSGLWADVRALVAQRRPFSLVRVGDGEGNVLHWAARSPGTETVRRRDMQLIWEIMFGASPRTDDLWDRLAELLIAAIAHAEVIGLPWLEDLDWAFTEASRYDELDIRPIDTRGAGGYVPGWEHVLTHRLLESSHVIATHRHVAHSLLSEAGGVVRAAGNLSLLTCYPDLLDRLHGVWGGRKGRTWLIPTEGGGRTGSGAWHFPDRFDELDAELAGTDLSGQLVFVAGGLLGKPYCQRIKASGGMAIDVGSAMDIWAGNIVRPYQTAELVERFRVQ